MLYIVKYYLSNICFCIQYKIIWIIYMWIMNMQAIQGGCFLNYKPLLFWVCIAATVHPDLLATCFLTCLRMPYRRWRLMQLHHLALSQLMLVSSRISQETWEAAECVHKINGGKQSWGWELSHQNSATHDPPCAVSDRGFWERIWSGSLVLINAGPFQGQPLVKTQLGKKRGCVMPRTL